MKTNNLYKNLTAKSKYLALCCALPVLMAACKQPEKYAECKELNKKIDSLSKEISATQNLRTARLPGHLRNTQSRYIDAADSVAQQSDTAQICLFQNDELWQEAFNNYAIRIGYDFQLSKFLPQSDIDIFKEQLANIFYDDFVCEMARERVLKDVGAAKIILDKDLNAEKLSEILTKMLKDKNHLLEMGKNAEKVAITDVEDKIYQEIQRLVSKKQ